MQVGSLVELINDSGWYNEIGIIYPVKNTIYTVRSVDTDRGGDIGLTLEEIINPLKYYQNPGVYGEKHFGIERFREIQPPMDISEVVQECFSLKDKIYV